MSNGFGNVIGIPPVKQAGDKLKSTVSGVEWQPDTSVVDDSNLPPRLATVGPLIADFNAPKASGWYRPNNAVNGPPSVTNYGHLFHQEWDGNNGHAHQLFNPMYGNEIWMRSCITYAWQGWMKISPIDSTNLPPRLRGMAQYEGDLNSVESGWCNWAPSATGAPTAGYGICQTIMLDGSQTRQWAWQYNTDLAWTRKRLNAVWEGWQQFWPPPINDGNLPARIASQSPQISDWNACTTSGWYCGNSAANGPPSTLNSQFYGEVINWSTGGFATQVLYTLVGSPAYEIWIREMYSSSWLAWKRIAPTSVDDTTLPDRLQTGAVVGSSSNLADANAFTVSGWAYLAASPGTNAPRAGTDWIIRNDAWNTNFLRQTAYRFYDGETWMRVNAGGWSAWVQIWPIQAASVPVNDTNLPTRIQSASVNFTPTDWNNATQSGFYQGNRLPNSPYNTHFHVIVSAHSPSYLTQVAIPLYYDEIWVRRCSGGSWSTWVKTYPVTEATLPVRIQAQNTQAPGNDANNANVSGWYYISPGGANVPGGGVGWWKLFTVNMNAPSNCTQTAWRYESDETWVRRCQDGIWRAWVQTWPIVSPPTTDSGWITFSITDDNQYHYDAPWGPVQFRRLVSGLVVWRGLCHVPDGQTTGGDIMGYIPAGYRPSMSQLFNVRCQGFGGSARVDVGGDGSIGLNGNLGGDAWFSLNEVHYMAEN